MAWRFRSGEPFSIRGKIILSLYNNFRSNDLSSKAIESLVILN